MVSFDEWVWSTVRTFTSTASGRQICSEFWLSSDIPKENGGGGGYELDICYSKNLPVATHLGTLLLLFVFCCCFAPYREVCLSLGVLDTGQYLCIDSVGIHCLEL